MSYSEALYMTVITISTVGFHEIRPLSTAGMYYRTFFTCPPSYQYYTVKKGNIASW